MAASESELTLLGRLGAHASWANTPDRSARTAPARAALEQKFLDAADGDPVQAAHLKKAHYARMALKSAQSRSHKRQETDAENVTGDAEASASPATRLMMRGVDQLRVDLVEPMIPVAEVSESNFWAALKPLLDLLNTTPMHQYAEGGIVFSIDRDEADMRMHVRFKAVVEAPLPVADVQPWPIVEVGDSPEFAELAYDVDVVVKPDGTDPINALWPGPFPAGFRGKAGA